MGNKIILRGVPDVHEEETALEAITPGHLVEITSSGAQKQTGDADNVEVLVAIERDEVGKGIDVACAIGDRVKVASFSKGHRFLGFIASGANVAKGAYLTTDNAGRLTASGVAAGIRIARALESVNNSAGPGDARIRVVVV